jgi:hypothetical protein
MLYVTAGAGCGKTTIIAHTIQHIKSTFGHRWGLTPAENADPTVCRHLLLYFFFHKRSIDEEGTTTAAMKAMISQLLHQAPDSCPVLLRQYQILSFKGSFSWTLEHLWGVFIKILETLPDSPVIYIILDGMDECERCSKNSLLTRLEDFIKILGFRDVESSSYRLKVMLSGRREEEILEILPCAKQFEITISDTAFDMRELIDTRVRQFSERRSLDLQTEQNLSHFLKEKANGMFLWVVLVMKELDSRSVQLSDEVIASKLRSVPTDLFAQYEAILKNIPEERRKDLWRIFRWILNSRRVLSVEELEVALSYELNCPSRLHDLKGDLNYLCGSVIRFENDNVSFIHQLFATLSKILFGGRWKNHLVESTCANTTLKHISQQFA